MYLLTEWDGQKGEYLAQHYDVWTAFSKVHVS